MTLRGILAVLKSPPLLLAAGLWFASPALSAARLELSQHWQFIADPGGSGEARGYREGIPAGTESITVPHTWNLGALHDYLGVGWYFLRFDRPSPAARDHVQLHFGATFYQARVWLNGVEVGTHEGGFTAYSFDVTAQLHDANLLVVRIDNRPGSATIPGFAEKGLPQTRYDWWTYGGLVRDVWLTVTGRAWVQGQRIRTQDQLDRWQARDRIELAGLVDAHSPVALHVRAFGPDGRLAAENSRSVTASEAEVALELKAPDLWNLDHPSLYRMEVELRDAAGRLMDRHSSTFGLRKVEIRDRHLLVNGERVRLTGMARHEDSPWEGLAETRGTMRHDLDDMKSLHTTLSRPVHYPQNPYVLDYADRHGILLIPEIPVWQFSAAQLADPQVIALAERQMREMIEEAGNHPSIFAWSVANESEMATPAGIAYFRALRGLIRKLDPDRYVSFADDTLPKLDRADRSAASEADFVMMNQYFGSWHGPASALPAALDAVDRLFPDKMVIISEMGFAGIFAEDAAAADRARIGIMREQMPLLAARDWIGGAILWCYQDYKSPRNLWPGLKEGYVEHGVVDEARQRKPSYAVWKELNRPAALSANWVKPAAAAGGPAGFSLAVTARTERDLPYWPLRDYRLDWSVRNAKGAAIASGQHRYADLEDSSALSESLPANAPAGAYRLEATLVGPTGVAAAELGLTWPEDAP